MKFPLKTFVIVLTLALVGMGLVTIALYSQPRADLGGSTSGSLQVYIPSAINSLPAISCPRTYDSKGNRSFVAIEGWPMNVYSQNSAFFVQLGEPKYSPESMDGRGIPYRYVTLRITQAVYQAFQPVWQTYRLNRVVSTYFAYWPNGTATTSQINFMTYSCFETAGRVNTTTTTATPTSTASSSTASPIQSTSTANTTSSSTPTPKITTTKKAVTRVTPKIVVGSTSTTEATITSPEETISPEEVVAPDLSIYSSPNPVTTSSSRFKAWWLLLGFLILLILGLVIFLLRHDNDEDKTYEQPEFSPEQDETRANNQQQPPV